MNILFIEDEHELAMMGAAQLELKGYTVFQAFDLAQAQAILDDPDYTVHYVITDHRLPDGMGVQFVIDIQGAFSAGRCAVVSACLTSADIEKLDANEIPYYHKPLLYGNVIDDLRRRQMSKARDYVKPPTPPPTPEPPPPHTSTLSEAIEEPSRQPEQFIVPARRKRFKLFRFKSK